MKNKTQQINNFDEVQEMQKDELKKFIELLEDEGKTAEEILKAIKKVFC